MQPEEKDAGPAPERRSVLVVDDEDAVSRALSRVLERAGYQVVVTSDGLSAVGAIASNPPFDVVLSDIQMPGTSGIELLRIIRSHDLDVPVILMTGYPRLETAIEAVSLGALQYITKPVDLEELLRVVARASNMHRLAKVKRESFRVLGKNATQPGDRAGLEVSLDRALDTTWMAFQPIVDAPGKRVFGYEALMRSKEPSLPHPGAVLSAAERLDRVFDVGRRVRALSSEAFTGAPDDLLLFVNLHTRDLLDPMLYEAAAPLTKIAHRVVLEITERSTLDDVKDVQTRVAALRGHGFRIAVDDLGAGYAGLSSFIALEPEIVKLDISLVRGIHGSPLQQRVVTAMTTLCKEMGMRVVAEGVEVAAERDCIIGLGCDLLQGYIFARPGPPFPAVEWNAPS